MTRQIVQWPVKNVDVSFKKNKSQCVAAVLWTSDVFHTELIIARISAGQKKAHHLCLWGIHANMLKYLVSQAIYAKKTKKDICKQLHHKPYLIYSQLLLILFVSALPCIWILTSRCLLNKLSLHLLKPLLWRTTYTNPSHS